jgi:hypothetical protein
VMLAAVFGTSILKDGYGRRAGLRDDATVAGHSPTTGRIYLSSLRVAFGAPLCTYRAGQFYIR